MTKEEIQRRFADPLVEAVAGAVGALLTGLAGLMMLVLTWQIVARFLPFLPATWTEELARWAFIYTVLLGAALAVRSRGHFGVSILTERLRGRNRRRYLRWAVHLPMLAAAVLLLVFGLRYTLEFGFVRRSPTFHIPMAWLFLALPVAAVPMTVFSAYDVLFPQEPAGEGDDRRDGEEARGHGS